MKKYDGKAVSATLSEEVKQAGQEYSHLEQVYMKVFGKPLPESKKPTIKGDGREIYYPDSEDSEENDDAERASLVAILSCQNQPVQDSPVTGQQELTEGQPEQNSSFSLNSKEPVQDAFSCHQNKEWFQRVFYTDYNCTSEYGKKWQAKRGERLRKYLDEHDACIRCKGSQS